VRKVVHLGISLWLAGCASARSWPQGIGEINHYKTLIPVARVREEGHFVIRDRGGYDRLRAHFGGAAHWDSLQVVAPDFRKSLIVGLAMSESGCGPQSLVTRVVVEADTVRIQLNRADTLGPCQTLFSWIELAVIAQQPGRPIVFVQPDSQWSSAPYVSNELAFD
jgi:hypothetical protein